MKIEACKAIAALARENVTEEVKAAYGGEDFSFGKDYILPGNRLIQGFSIV